MSSIAEGIRRIEKRLIHIETGGRPDGHVESNPNTQLKDVLTQHPIAAFNNAYDSGNLELAVLLLPRIKRLIGLKEWLQCGGNLAHVGEPAGEEVVLEALQHAENLDHELIVNSIYSLRQYYFNRNLNEQGEQTLRKIINQLIVLKNMNDQEKSSLLTQLGLFQDSISNYEEALKTLLESLKLDESVISISNVANAYARLNRFDEAVDYVDKFINMENVNEASLQIALFVYENLNQIDDVRKTEERLLAENL